MWIQHHATKKWYKTAIIIEIRHGGRAYLVKDDLGQSYVRGRRFLRLDDRATSGHTCRVINFRGLSPFSSFGASGNAPSDQPNPAPLSDHSSSKCDADISTCPTSIMHSPSSDPSSPEYAPQSRFHPRGRRSYIVNPVPTLVCGVTDDVVAITHQFNHVPRGPLLPVSPPAYEGGAKQQPLSLIHI